VKSRKVQQIYTRLLDYHKSIWKMIVSSQFEGLPVVWNLLRTEILKLQPILPIEVGVFLVSYPYIFLVILLTDCKLTIQSYRWKASI
jgi:hypothetical protein